MQSIGASLLAQYDVLTDALEQAIEFCPDDQWTIDGDVAGAPVRQVCHILGALDTCCMKRCWCGTRTLTLRPISCRGFDNRRLGERSKVA